MTNETVGTLGIIAGAGELPLIVARTAAGAGVRVVAARVEGFGSHAIGAYCVAHDIFPVGQLSKVIGFLQGLDAEAVVMCGQVDHREVFKLQHLDDLMRSIFANADLRAEAILGAIAAAIEAEGLPVADLRHWLGPHLMQAGYAGARQLDEKQRTGAEFGLSIARKVADINAGQSIAVRDGVVVAVEAVEGTDRMIRRCAELGVPGCIVIKLPTAAKDPRFDLPVIGPRTIASLTEAKAAALIVEAGMTIVLEPEELRWAADAAGIAVLAIERGKGLPA